MRNSRCWLGIATLLLLSAGQVDSLESLLPMVVPKNCTCIPFYQCANRSVTEDGASLIDIRLTSGGCESYLDMCCGTSPTPMDSEDKFLKDAEEGLKDFKGGCGILHPEGVAFRITGATHSESQFGEFPWMAAVLQPVKDVLHENSDSREDPKIETVLKYLCGGSLIHPRVVLTGAHCVASLVDSSLTVRVGEWDSRTTKEIYKHQDRAVSKVFIHPLFKSSNLFNDVALLLLSEPVRPAKHIAFICLPPKDEPPPDATMCLASGWGKDGFGKAGKYSAILKRLNLPIVSRDKCQHNLRKTRLGRHFRLHHSFICAGGERGKDTCQGDGGGPLVCPDLHNPERYMQFGIVAWGIGCMNEEVPGVYGNVAFFRNWIDKKMKDLGLETSYYTN